MKAPVVKQKEHFTINYGVWLGDTSIGYFDTRHRAELMCAALKKYLFPDKLPAKATCKIRCAGKRFFFAIRLPGVTEIIQQSTCAELKTAARAARRFAARHNIELDRGGK